MVNPRGRLSPQASWIRRGILSRDAAKALKDGGIMKLTVLNYIMFKVS